MRRHIIVFFILQITFLSAGFSRIGESEERCMERYGIKEKRPPPFDGPFLYSGVNMEDGTSIDLIFLKNKCVHIRYKMSFINKRDEFVRKLAFSLIEKNFPNNSMKTRNEDQRYEIIWGNDKDDYARADISGQFPYLYLELWIDTQEYKAELQRIKQEELQNKLNDSLKTQQQL
jgi:hypothetical protein